MAVHSISDCWGSERLGLDLLSWVGLDDDCEHRDLLCWQLTGGRGGCSWTMAESFSLNNIHQFFHTGIDLGDGFPTTRLDVVGG